MVDPDFRADAARRNMVINPVSCQDKERVQRKIMETPDSAVLRIKRFLEL